jgi:hypothetical protein
MVPDAKSLAYLFSECMIFNDNVFCAEDFYKLLFSHRINIEELNFDDIVKNTLFSFNQKGYDKIYFSTKHCEKIYWHPYSVKNLDIYSIEYIISDLKLDLDNEFNSDNIFTNYVNHLRKINNYIKFVQK